SGGQHCASVFVDRSGRVLASSPVTGALPAMPVGSRLAIPADMLQLPVGKSLSRAMLHDGHYCIVGCSVTQGYREFRAGSNAPEAVLALSFASFGARLEHAEAAVQCRSTHLLSDNSGAPGAGREMATFFVDARPFALDAACVLEALPASAISKVSAGRLPYCM